MAKHKPDCDALKPTCEGCPGSPCTCGAAKLAPPAPIEDNKRETDCYQPTPEEVRAKLHSMIRDQEKALGFPPDPPASTADEVQRARGIDQWIALMGAQKLSRDAVIAFTHVLNSRSAILAALEQAQEKKALAELRLIAAHGLHKRFHDKCVEAYELAVKGGANARFGELDVTKAVQDIVTQRDALRAELAAKVAELLKAKARIEKLEAVADAARRVVSDYRVINTHEAALSDALDNLKAKEAGK